MTFLNSLILNKKTTFLLLGTTFILTEITYYIYKRTFRKRNHYHQILFFSATVNNNWRNHPKKECEQKECFCHNFYIIKNYLNNIKKTLDICLYLITSQEIAQSIISAHERGVKVRVITDYEMSHSSGSKITLFKSHGIPVRLKKANNLMHHKFCILDGDEPFAVLMTGSLNLTMQAVAGNWDNVMFTSQPQLVKQFKSEFHRIWEDFK